MKGIESATVIETPVIFVTGPPASGKTHVADHLAANLSLPLIAKDTIKETLFEALGTGDAAWSRRLGRATFDLLYEALERKLSAGRSVIVEANFDGVHAPARFAEIRRRYRIAPFEIHCTASEEVLGNRYAERAALRHPGHADAERLAEPTSALRDEACPALDLGGPIVILDTTDLATVDLASLVPACAAHVGLADDAA
jgi:predicted kinase